MIADMHCDTIARLYAEKNPDVSLYSAPGYQVDIEKLKKSGYLLQNFALFLDLDRTPHPMETALAMADLYERELAKNKDSILPALSRADIEANQKAKKLSALLTLEEGDILEGSLANLRRFYGRGARMITLTWNHSNSIGHPNLCFDANGMPQFQKRCNDGLTSFGLDFIQEMEDLGMIIDVSHLSDGGFWDVYHHTKAPFAASHSNAAAVCNVCRNLTDDMIRALAERGGVMGLNFCTSFLAEEEPPNSPADIAAAISSPSCGRRPVSLMRDIIRHARHITNTGGIEVCALGSDFDGIDNDVEFGDASGMELLFDAFKKEGFSECEIDKIFYRNVLRVYHDVL